MTLKRFIESQDDRGLAVAYVENGKVQDLYCIADEYDELGCIPFDRIGDDYGTALPKYLGWFVIHGGGEGVREVIENIYDD